MKALKQVTLAAVLGALSMTALAEIKPFEAVEYRKGIFKAVKWQFGPMGDMVKGKIDYDAEEFSRRATNLAALSHMPLEGFRAGTYASSTSALPSIEDDWQTFADTMTQFQNNTAALQQAAASGDMKTIKPAFITVARTCKSCHDKFKD
ncbi:c-type cytochrome [Bacterioplanes sanyensis]|uniref:c-type cytochrome n=1 Tax=Bacterioplanes sanyensis TaxID=1249553 RepID=UPI0012FDE4AC|nr:cytochrome c [Bacterioplanes sanyensis]